MPYLNARKLNTWKNRNGSFFAVNTGRSVSCITPLQTAPMGNALTQNNLYGSGIITAIIDSGIDYAHPDFCNADGTTRILELWDQSLDRIFTQAEINEALQAPLSQERYQLVPSRDLSGHGTHVAGIAAGNGRASDGQYRGVAPLSSLLIVKLGISDPDGFPRTTELMRAIDYVLQKAFSWQMPVAINLSLAIITVPMTVQPCWKLTLIMYLLTGSPALSPAPETKVLPGFTLPDHFSQIVPPSPFHFRSAIMNPV